MVQYCSKKNSVSISRVLYHIGTLELLAPLKLLMVASIINLESRITTCFCCFLPSNLREQRSNIGILGIAAHSIVVSPAQRRLVSVPVTKHCCLTAVNRCGALCCPDFPRDRGLKRVFFFPYPAIDRYTIFVRFALRSPKISNFWGRWKHQAPQQQVVGQCARLSNAKERHTGIEPASSAWEADALPMC